jgi:hypothetical protein
MEIAYLHSYNKLMIAINNHVNVHKLSWFKNHIYKKSLIEPENSWSKKYYFEKLLDLKINFKLK